MKEGKDYIYKADYTLGKTSPCVLCGKETKREWAYCKRCRKGRDESTLLKMLIAEMDRHDPVISEKKRALGEL